MRHFPVVQVFLDRDIRRRADGADFREDADVLNELTGLFQRLWRTERIVEQREIDLAAVDSTVVVDFNEESGNTTTLTSEIRRPPAQSDSLSQFDLGWRDARRISSPLCAADKRQHGHGAERQRVAARCAHHHPFPPRVSWAIRFRPGSRRPVPRTVRR